MLHEQFVGLHIILNSSALTYKHIIDEQHKGLISLPKYKCFCLGSHCDQMTNCYTCLGMYSLHLGAPPSLSFTSCPAPSIE